MGKNYIMDMEKAHVLHTLNETYTYVCDCVRPRVLEGGSAVPTTLSCTPSTGRGGGGRNGLPTLAIPFTARRRWRRGGGGLVYIRQQRPSGRSHGAWTCGKEKAEKKTWGRNFVSHFFCILHCNFSFEQLWWKSWIWYDQNSMVLLRPASSSFRQNSILVRFSKILYRTSLFL